MTNFDEIEKALEVRGRILAELAGTCRQISEALGTTKEKDHGTV